MGALAELRRSSPLTVLVAGAAAGVGFIYGYDLSNLASSLLFLQTDFALSSADQELIALAAVVGQLAGAGAGGWLANTVGRQRCMVALTAGYAVFAVLSAAAVSIPMLLGTRFLLGVALGVAIVVVPVFVAESVPAAVRGSLLVLYGLATVGGIIAGYLGAYLLSGLDSWRWLLGVAAVPAVGVALLLRRVPDTARWYLLRGRTEQARRVLHRVEPGVDADAELAEIARAVAAEQAQHVGVLAEMLRLPYLRATVFVVGLGFFIQITGINAIVYYSPRLFETMGFSGYAALLVLPALVQCCALAAVFVSLLLVDRVGRRPILLTGIAVMIAANVLLVGVFCGADVLGAAVPYLQFGGVVAFTVGYTFGFGSLVWVYAGESLPARLRSMGSSAMLSANLLANAVVVGVFLTLLERLGGAGTFTVFAVMAVASFAFVYRYAPETKGRQLEDIRHYWENHGRWPEPTPTEKR
ncbi:sugar porter family MFS transporter [Mycobacterium koreense]|uniref:MFS transporter n=1 Tax=Mycolicibacillus koreensis TaxID=1069220 RepID=A0A7I7SD64_9MYCO|nr:sugar porter family MFS transporter [Mycolicibacillus koreensis]MCV7250219.1 sugar porter family MFS transporter [Mycolicibacillus koreensis]OSC33249.1 MFS transporter [Mycolicibacillus koreensis]BBY54867.1 putative sugar-transport integral membrane protein [Mycolicibacillus koreensis]